MESTYVPYSIRNNTPDTKLAPVLDYVERVMGWEIAESKSNTYDSALYTFSACHGVSPYLLIINKDRVQFEGENISRELFVRGYQAILPIMRDLMDRLTETAALSHTN